MNENDDGIDEVQIAPFTKINTPNKSVHSYFDKTDASFYTKRNTVKIDDTNTLYLTITNTSLKTYDGELVELDDFFVDLSINRRKFGSISNAMGFLKNLIEPIAAKSKKEYVAITFVDWMTRTEIISTVDLMVNALGYKGIFLVPNSLAISVAQCSPYSIVVHVFDSYMSLAYIDENCLVDSHRFGVVSEGFKTCDEEYYVEEFTKRVQDEAKYSCKFCSATDTIAAMVEHVRRNHLKRTSLKDDAVADRHLVTVEELSTGKDVWNTISSYLKLVESDRNKRAFNVIICDQTVKEPSQYEDFKEKVDAMTLENDKYNVIEVSDIKKAATDGLYILANLDGCKDMWMGRSEWCDYGLKVLKEKVLFNV